jgi:raffinose/stachyose/melibiose transport system substrate-binding protein
MEDFLMRSFCRVFLVVALSVGLLVSFGQQGRAEDITLEMWDNLVWDVEDDIINTLIKEFEEQNNCKVQRTTRTLEDTKTAVMAAVRSGKVGDIILVNNGETMMGPLVRGGHLATLDKYAEQFGWLERLFSPDLLTRNRYTEDGSVFGTGNLYAISSSGELVGVFYNKGIFEKLGLLIPKSLAEFEATLEKIKAAGEVPLTFGSLKRSAIFHVYGEVEHALVSEHEGRQYLDKLVMNWADDVSWESTSTIEGARIMQDWVKKGYFTQGFAGIGYDDSVQLFAAGKGAMMIAGSWIMGTLQESPNEFGFFPFPPVDPSKGMAMQVGGVRTPYGIPVASSHQELAAKLLDHIMTSEEAQKMFVEAEFLPAAVPADLSVLEEDTLFYDVMKAWNDVNASNNVGHYLDWATPTFYDTLAIACQEMMALKITPEEFAAKLQADYAQWMKDKPNAE